MPGVRGHPQPREEKRSEPGSPGLAEEGVPASGIPPKHSPVYRTELRFKVWRGGEIGPPMATEEAPLFLSGKPQPSRVTPVQGGGYAMKPDGHPPTSPRSEGSVWQDEAGQRSSPRIPLPNVIPEQYRRIPGEPLSLQRRPRSPHTLPPPKSPRVSSPECDSPPYLQELSSQAKSDAPAGCTSVETFFWDKERILHQLDHGLRRMLQASHPEVLHSLCPPCRCHVETYPRDVAFPRETSVGQRSQEQGSTPLSAKEAEAASAVSSEEEEVQPPDLSSGESTTDISLLGQEVSQEHLLKPSKVGAGNLLCTHVTQKALGSFLLPSCVICSHSRYQETVAKRHRQRTREQRTWLNCRFLQRTSHRDEFRDTCWGLSWEEHGASRVGQKQQAPGVVHEGETREGAGASPWEVSPQAQKGPLSSGEGRESSGQDSKGSGEPYPKQLSPGSFLEADDELPAPPSDWIQSEGEEEGAERKPQSKATLLCNGTSWRSPGNPLARSSLPVEDWSQFSTEYEEERVGDWNSDSVAPSSVDQAKEEGRRGPKVVLNSRSCRRPRGGGGPKEADGRVSLIASILDKKLWLQQGLHTWLGCQGGQGAGWRQRERQPPASFQEDPRGHPETLVEGAAPGRWGDPSSGAEAGGKAHRQVGRTPVPGSQLSETETGGSPLRPSTSTSSTCDHVSPGTPSRPTLSRKRSWRVEGELAWDRHRRTSLRSAAGEREGLEGSSHERGAGRGEWRVGSGEWAPSVREVGSHRRGGPAAGHKEGTSSGAQTPSSKEWTPPGIRRRLLTREWRLQRREKVCSTGRVRFKDPCLSPVQGGEINPERGVVLRSGRHQSSRRTPPHSSACVARGHQVKMETGFVAQEEASRAALRGQHQELPDSTPTRPLGKPKVPLYGEHFHSLKEKILLRRRELGSSLESEEEEEEKLV